MYTSKYLKYKKKYLELQRSMRQQQTGGATDDGFNILDNINFWARQLMEHSIILYLGLEDAAYNLDNEKFESAVPKLKEQAGANLQKWKQFLNKHFYSKGVKFEPTKVFLTEGDYQKLGNGVPAQEAIGLIDETIKFNQDVVNELAKGKWIGWIFPSLAEHMLKEAKYFKTRVDGSVYTPEEYKKHINWINTHNSEEIGATGQLFDPNPANSPLIEKAHAYATKAMTKYGWSEQDLQVLQGLDTGEKATFIRLSLKYGQELTKFAEEGGPKIISGEIKSIISPLLANHVYREFVRFTKILENYQNQKIPSA